MGMIIKLTPKDTHEFHTKSKYSTQKCTDWFQLSKNIEDIFKIFKYFGIHSKYLKMLV